ncbi:hypothetical protein [Kitasatospora sp. NPDC090091]|uniref:hypothetical protein n=1 Tax=Kitasatospora sp. NPDC090091 TaxID=3364081 RepID=UPI0038275313
MGLTVALLAVLLAGTAALGWWERERWRRALTSEQLQRRHDKLAAQAQVVELRGAVDEWAQAAAAAIEHRDAPDQRGLERLHLLLWEREETRWERP